MSSVGLMLGSSARRFPPGYHIPPRGGFSATDDEIGLPDGVAHGVPEGETVALCGAAPRYLWSAPFTGEKSRVLEVCGSCRDLLAVSAPAETGLSAVADPWAVAERTPATPDRAVGALGAGSEPYRHVPPPPIGTPPQEGRRERDRRRRVNAVKSVLPALAIGIAFAVASQYEGGADQSLARAAPDGPAAQPAVWRADPDLPPRSDARSFTALVSRAGCGDVLAPQVIENPSSVVVVFSVAPAAAGESEPCTMDAEVPYSVPLYTQLGERALFDGTCDLPPASTTPACASAQRWPLER